MRIKVKAEDLARPEMREAQRQIRQKVKDGMAKAAERAVVPKVRMHSPSIVRSIWTAKSSGGRAYITTRGARKLDRIAGLLNYGGVVSEHIAPKRKKALTIGSTGEVRALVTKPRRVHGSAYVGRGVESGQSQMEEIVLDEVMTAFKGFPTSEH